MRKITYILVKRFWGLCALLLIGLAVIVIVGRELAPQVTHYRENLEAYLSEAMGVQVSIGTITANWEGLSPELEFRRVTVTSLSGERILSVDTAFAELSLLRSLFKGELVLGQLEFVDIAIGFRQRADGGWSLRGLDAATRVDENIDINDPLDIFLLGDHIECRGAQFTFDFRTGHSSRVELPHLTLENSGDFHRLRSEVAVDRNRDVLALVIEARGDPRNLDNFTAKGHLRLQQFELDKAIAALPGRLWDGLPNQEWRKGHQLNLEAWFDIAAGMAIRTRGRLDIGELPVDLNTGVAMPKRTTASFAGHWARDGAWELAFRNLSLAWEEVQAPPLDLLVSSVSLGEPVYLQAKQLDLSTWLTVARTAGLVEGKALAALDVLQPRGKLRNINLSLAGTRLENLTLRANLENLAVASWRGAPAVEQVNGYLEATPFSGFVDLASEQGFSMHYPTLYHQPIAFATARGRVHWQIDTAERTVNVHSGLLSADSEAGEGRGYFSLFVPFDFGSRQEELVLQVGLRNSEARYHKQFVPYILPDSLIGWLDRSVTAGRLNAGGFIYRGGLTRASAARAAIQLYLDVEEAELAYQPGWPALKRIDGTVWLDDRQVVAELHSARLLDTQVEHGRVSLKTDADREGLLLNIAGRSRGKASDGLRLVRETPLGDLLGSRLSADWILEGDMQTSVDVSFPLTLLQGAQAGDIQVRGKPVIDRVDVELRNARLALGDLNLQFDAVGGRIRYSDKQGLQAEQLRGQLWGQPVSANIERTSGAGKAEQALSLKLTGGIPMQSLHEWSGRPELRYFTGKTAFEADLVVPYGQLIAGEQLVGTGQSIERGESIEEHQSTQGGQAVKGQNGEMARLTVRTDLHGVAIDLPRPFGKTAGARRPLTITAPLHQTDRSFDVQFGTFVVDGFTVENVHFRGEDNGDHWRLTVNSPFVSGATRLYSDARQPIRLDLDYLRLPQTEAAVSDTWAALDPGSLPAMDIAVHDFSVGGKEYGSWSFQLRPTATGLVARQITGAVRGGKIVGLQAGQGAELFWENNEGEVSSRFNGRFVTDNLGKVLQQWGQPRLLDSKSSRFDVRLSWPGSPAAIALTALQGDMVMAVKDGAFIRGATGEAGTGSALLKLIAFFNIDTWRRRLRLDFSDITADGTAFETIDGALQFDRGKVHMNTPLVVNSHASRFQMAGEVDLVASRLDTKLVATIPVGSNLTFVAALTGMGLPVVAGMWLISKVFEEQIGKMSSLSFQITGPLDNPDMDFVRLFDDQVVRGDAAVH
jgi:uncharacterized protein YhdP